MALQAKLSRLLMQSHPDHAARTLEQLSADQAAAVIDTAGDPIASSVVGRMETARAADCLRECSARRAAEIVTAMRVEKVVVLLRGWDSARREALLGDIDADHAKRIRRMLAYPEGSAGSLMDTALVAFPEDIAAGEALRRARRQTRGLRFYVFVTDRDHKLVGVLTLRELMQAHPRRSLGDVARQPVERLHDRDPRERILRHPAWKSFHALPVVDDAGLLVGVLRYETLRRLEAETDAARPPDLLDVGAALTHIWVSVAALALDGLGRSLTAPPPGATSIERDSP